MDTSNQTNQRLMVLIIVLLFNIYSVTGGTNSKNSSNSGLNKEEIDIAKINDAGMLSIPQIAGTTWSVISIYTKGAHPASLINNPEFTFGKTGKYEFQALTNSMGQSGAYKVRGNTVTTYQDGPNRSKTSFVMTWNSAGNFMELYDGKLVFRMQYKGKVDY